MIRLLLAVMIVLAVAIAIVITADRQSTNNRHVREQIRPAPVEVPIVGTTPQYPVVTVTPR